MENINNASDSTMDINNSTPDIINDNSSQTINNISNTNTSN